MHYKIKNKKYKTKVTFQKPSIQVSGITNKIKNIEIRDNCDTKLDEATYYPGGDTLIIHSKAASQ